jgi:hypothetical protein
MSFKRPFSPITIERGLSQFLSVSLAAAIAAALHLVPVAALADSDHDCVDPHFAPNADCGTHNMMLVGANKAYLSHLPMFDSEHRFQLIFEATFEITNDDETTNVEELYTDDRKAHPGFGMYTVNPSHIFVLSRLFDESADSRRVSFAGTVFRGHLERPGSGVISGLDEVEVKVSRVIYARELEADGDTPDQLRYVLFGDSEELFLAHEITEPPDFDQIVSVHVDGHRFTSDELLSGIVVSIPERENTAETRLRVDDSVKALAQVAGVEQPSTLRIRVVSEPYFEEGELLAEPTFDPTPLEIEAGFVD